MKTPLISHQRYNIYTLIHKGLRASLGQTLVDLGRVDHTDPLALADQLAQTHSLLDFCQAHLEHENHFIHRALNQAQPDIPLQTAADHLDHEREIAELKTELSRIPTLSEADRRPALLALYREFSLFVSENLAHMWLEDIDNAAQLWRNFSEEQIAQIHQRLLQSLSPEENLQSLLMMLPNICFSERLELLGAVRQGAPAEAFANLLALLPPLLPAAEWRKLSAALEQENAAVAAI